jgi:hypothetical protein
MPAVPPSVTGQTTIFPFGRALAIGPAMIVNVEAALVPQAFCAVTDTIPELALQG